MPQTGAITLSGCTGLVQMKSPKVVTGNLSITNASSNAENMFLTEMPGLDTVRGTLRITAANFTEIEIPHIKSIGTFSHTSGTKLLALRLPDTDTIGTLALSNLTALTTFEAPVLRCTNSFSMSNLQKIEHVDVPLLESAGTLFRFYGGGSSLTASRSTVTKLDWFSSLKKAEKAEIRYCGNLTDFTGLSSLANNLSDESAWVVSGNRYNPTLADMKNGKYTMQ